MIPNSNYAIVIGINDYHIPQGSLKGAVNDAARMWQWLTDPNGGNVPQERVLLFLSSPPLNPPPQFPISFYSATKPDFMKIIDREFRKRKEEGERLFFFFSGHGIADRRTLTLEQSLLMQDFESNATESSFRVIDMLNFFKATNFTDQIFLIDACNNLPPDWDTEYFVVGQWTLELHVPPGHVVQQYALAATSPGGVTIEIGEKGVFTDVLMEGLLQGRGKAKVYDPSHGDYVVKVGRLFTFVEDEVPRKLAQAQALVSNIPARGGIQQMAPPSYPYLPQPYFSGRVHGKDNDPVFRRIPADLIAKEPLTVHVDPLTVVPGVDIYVRREDQVVANQKCIQNVQDLPVAWFLPPREYLIEGAAPHHKLLKKKGQEVDLYEPCQELLQFELDNEGGLVV